MVILSHPTGNSFVRAAAMGLAEAGALSEFNTTIASFDGSFLDYLSKISFFAELKRRKYDTSLKVYTKTWPWKEVGRQIALQSGLHKLAVHEAGIFSVDSVYRSLDRYVASRLMSGKEVSTGVVYAYEDGAIQSFISAKQVGMKCLYDLPIGYWKTARRLLGPERQRWPEWIPTLTGFSDSERKLARKDAELRMADHIIVASKFTATTLEDFEGTLPPVSIIPYGFPPVGKTREYDKLPGNRKLKLIFVGGLSQRKGVADLFAAVEGLRQYVELTVVGNKSTNECLPLNEALKHHKWIPSLPHNEILKIMREHDVLLFPSLFEGFGLVITEAMSQGTPVITTERTAGPDLINHGKNGWLIQAGSTNALREAIENLLDKPGSIQAAGREAMHTASLRPWQVYGSEIAALINKITG